MLLVNQLTGFGASSEAASFSPLDIAGCQLWIRSDLGITKDGSDRVGTWADQSGNSRDFTQGTDANKPIWQSAAYGSHNAIRFDGSNDQMVTPSFSLSQPFTALMVAKILTHTNLDGLWFGNAAVAPGLYMQSSPTISINDSNTGATQTRSSTGNLELTKSLFNGTSSVLAVNDGSDSAGGSSFTSAITAGFAIGSWGAAAGSRFGNIDILEFIVYNSAITGANLTSVKSYLNSRYALW
jgi:hypothetical protein